MVYTSTGAAGAARRGTDDSVYTQFQRKAARRIMSNVHAAARSLAVFLFWASCEILILTTVHTIANLRWCIGNCGAPLPPVALRPPTALLSHLRRGALEPQEEPAFAECYRSQMAFLSLFRRRPGIVGIKMINLIVPHVEEDTGR